MEHSPITLESAHNIILATRGTRTIPFIRVPVNELWTAKRALDIKVAKPLGLELMQAADGILRIGQLRALDHRELAHRYGRLGLRLAELTGYTAPRQMLHSCQLAFIHPRTAKRLSFKAPRPADFLDALTALRWGGR